MVQVLIFLLELWKKRYYILLPVIALPALFLMWSMLNKPLYLATTTMHLDQQNAPSPLLKNMTEPDHIVILERILKSPQVMEDTLLASGLLMEEESAVHKQKILDRFSRNIGLDVLNDEFIRLNYISSENTQMEKTLEQLSYNFIDEILVPERLRTEHQLVSLSEQIKYYDARVRDLEKTLLQAQQADTLDENLPALSQKRLKEIITLEFDLQRFKAQKGLAEEEYALLLSTSKTLKPRLQSRQQGQVYSSFRFVEPPTLLPPIQDFKQHISYMLDGLILAILLSIVTILYSHFTDKSLRSEVDIRRELGLKILGHIPNLGDVRVEDGQLTASLRTPL